MNMARMAGMVLIVAGGLILAYGGFTYTRETHTADVGALHLSVDEKERINIPVWAGIGTIVLGGILLLLGNGKNR